MNEAGPPGASSNGFNENLALFQQGKCGMWIDATVAASFVTNPKDSTVADKVGFALAPDTGLGKNGNWLWAWIARHPRRLAEGRRGAEVHRLGDQQGLHSSSSRRRKAGPTCLRAPAPRSTTTRTTRRRRRSPKMTLDSINAADPTKPTVKPVPYIGVQFVAIPEFQGIGTTVGQLFSAALAGQTSGRRRARPARSRRDARNDPGRLHQVASPEAPPPGPIAARGLGVRSPRAGGHLPGHRRTVPTETGSAAIPPAEQT